MSETTNNENSFVGFEYKDVIVKKTMQSVYSDSYKSFGWIIPYLLFKSISEKKTEQVNPFICQKYEDLYSVCEKANELLN